MAESGRRPPRAGGEEPVNAMRVEIYRRLMEAQERIAHVLYRREVSHEDVMSALDAVDEQMTDEERTEDLYLAALEHYVTALGGRIEVRAVFGEEVIVVRRSPGGEGQ
jgi:pyruvate/2-oxoglutarate dehydrogenase complex dihydrolipoamide acyltransferase (E2) component